MSVFVDSRGDLVGTRVLGRCGATMAVGYSLLRRAVSFTWTPTCTAAVSCLHRLHSTQGPKPAAVSKLSTLVREDQLEQPLPFVNRYAEALDVLVPNLRNQQALAGPAGAVQRIVGRYCIKRKAPLAGQPTGTGKTMLGCCITDILSRSREAAGSAQEAAVAARLRGAWCWKGGAAEAVDNALRDTSSSENLVVRTLLDDFPEQRDTILQLKGVVPLVIEMQSLLQSVHGLTLDQAIAFAIFCTAKGSPHPTKDLELAYRSLSLSEQSAAGLVNMLITEGGAKPMLLVFDDITALQQPGYEGYAGKAQEGVAVFHSLMKELNAILQRLHGVRGCFVYCTGRSLVLSALAQAGAPSPLLVEPVVLRPLSANDIMQLLELPSGASHAPLLSDMRVQPEYAQYFADRVHELTGGVARLVQYALRLRQHRAAGSSALLASREAIDEALEELYSWMPQIPGMQLGVDRNGPTKYAAEGVPKWVENDEQQARLIQLLARLLLLDMPFDAKLAVRVGKYSLRVADAAVILGLSYTAALAQSDLDDAVVAPHVDLDVAAAGSAAESAADARGSGKRPAAEGKQRKRVMNIQADATKPSALLRIVAGEWLCRSLMGDALIASHEHVHVSVQMLVTMRQFGGTMRGRPFEMLCADALCFRSVTQRGKRLARFLPHLADSRLRDAVVPQLSVVALPKAVAGGGVAALDDAVTAHAATADSSAGDDSAVDSSGVSLAAVANLPIEPTVAARKLRPLTDEEKAQLMKSRYRWCLARKQICKEDLPWLLQHWLPVGCAGVPADAQSGSQDYFLRLDGGVIGFALKAAGPTSPTGWSAIREELGKAPVFGAGVHYTLVLWSLNLAPEVRRALGEADAVCFSAGSWYLSATGKLVLGPSSPANKGEQPVFVVGSGMELVVANPHAPGGGGLQELLGRFSMATLRDMDRRPGGLAVALLADWTAKV